MHLVHVGYLSDYVMRAFLLLFPWFCLGFLLRCAAFGLVAVGLAVGCAVGCAVGWLEWVAGNLTVWLAVWIAVWIAGWRIRALIAWPAHPGPFPVHPAFHPAFHPACLPPSRPASRPVPSGGQWPVRWQPTIGAVALLPAKKPASQMDDRLVPLQLTLGELAERRHGTEKWIPGSRRDHTPCCTHGSAMHPRQSLLALLQMRGTAAFG